MIRKPQSTIAVLLLFTAGTLACQDSPLPSEPTPSFDHVAGHCVVTSTADAGAGTLREAVIDVACTSITFAVTGTITLTSDELFITRDLSIVGPGADKLTVERSSAVGTPKFKIISAVNGTTVYISGLTMTNGHAAGDGGAIWTQGNLHLDDMRLYNNKADGVAGALALGAASTIKNSTISHNQSVSGGGGLVSWGPSTITNVTISHNTGSFGTAIANVGTIKLSHATMFGNAAINGTIWGPGQTTLRNTILESGYNCFGNIVDGGYNIDSGNTCPFSAVNNSQSNVNTLLGALTNNGGSTPTHALPVGSPAIDAGVCTDLDGNNVATDQRGLGRPQPTGGACDVGAYELDRYDFTGFFEPVDNLPTVNVVKAGNAIPIRFSLGANEGMNIFAAGYPKVTAIACDNEDPEEQITEALTAGNSSLNYNAAANQYLYIWKTDRAWAGTCRELTIEFVEGTVVTAQFKFTR